jgi:hypothetical protein
MNTINEAPKDGIGVVRVDRRNAAAAPDAIATNRSPLN